MDEQLALLEKEFCPPLDAALVHAVYLDFAEHRSTLLIRAREVLDPLRLSAIVEQATTDFDPSGSSGQDAAENYADSRLEGEDKELSDTDSGNSNGTDLTSLSNGLSSLGLLSSTSSGSGVTDGSPSPPTEYMEDVGTLDIEEKEEKLSSIFPTISRRNVSHTLKKCGGDYFRATDELLNHVYFEEDGGVADGEEKVVTKGIDAFAEEYRSPSSREKKKRKKKKKKKKTLLPEYEAVPGVDSAGATSRTNKWHTATKDIDFLSQRTNIPAQTVQSLYHSHGGSLPATIVALLESPAGEAAPEGAVDNFVLQQNMADLAKDFKSIQAQHITALIRITHPSTAAAHELAKALVTVPKDARIGGIKVIPRYTPISLASPTTPAIPSTTSSSSSSPLISPVVALNAAALSERRSTAFTQASAAFRKGKSDPLMKAVAGYYGQLGRDYSAALSTASAVEADALAERQSGPNHLDLHGVSVKDATRIAREKVTAWWAGLGEQRVAGWVGFVGVGGQQRVYRVVTGLGRHSEGGRGKIGPAVAKMLVREGWKVEVGRGELIVSGVARVKVNGKR